MRENSSSFESLCYIKHLLVLFQDYLTLLQVRLFILLEHYSFVICKFASRDSFIFKPIVKIQIHFVRKKPNNFHIFTFKTQTLLKLHLEKQLVFKC